MSVWLNRVQTIYKFSSETTVFDRITDGDESAHMREIEHLFEWCRNNNLSLGIKKTKQLIFDFKKGKPGNHLEMFLLARVRSLCILQ